MYDSFGDGWDGSQVTVEVNNTVVGSGTVTLNFASFNFTSCNGDDIDIYYQSGGGIFENEISFSLILEGQIVYNSGVAPPNGLIQNINVDCDIEIEPTSDYCNGAEPICTDDGLSFTASATGIDAMTTEPGNNYSCYGSAPNPTWYFLEIDDPGNINMSLSAPQDIDFIIWGPFDDVDDAVAACGSLGQNPTSVNGSVIDCSFSATNNETPDITNAQSGDVYMMLITNYANVTQEISLEQVGGNGSTNCDILCDIEIDFTVGACDPLTNRYSISGTMEFESPPETGSLIIEDCDGNQLTFPAPFSSPTAFTFPDLYPDAQLCNLEVYFTDDPTCIVTENFSAPLPCCTDPTFSTSLPSCLGSCDGLIEVTSNGAGPFDYEIVDLTDNSTIHQELDQPANWNNGSLCTGSYAIIITDINDCSSTNAFSIGEGPDYTNIEEDIFGCESVTVNNVTYTTSQTVMNSYLTAAGCDSTVTSNITVLPVIPNTINDINLCPGQIHIEGSSVYDSAGTYTDTYITENNCDSTVVTNITMIGLIEHTESVTICPGTSYTVGGNTYTTAGTYTNMLQTPGGCDSLLTTILDVGEIITENYATICYGEVYTEGTDFYLNSGTYTYVYPNQTAQGCDSTVITHLDVIPWTNQTVSVLSCIGQTYTFGEQEITTSGIYTEVFSSQFCENDSTVTLNIFFLPPPETTVDLELCEGESIDIEGTTYTAPNTVIETYPSYLGCDSTVTTILSLDPCCNDLSSDNFVSICEGESIIIDGVEQSTAGTYSETLTSVNGCDSIVNTILTVNPVYETDVPVTICEGESITVDGIEYSSAGTYPETFIAINGCDSIVNTILTVNPVYETDVPVTICDGESIIVDGVEQSTAGTYPEIFTALNGCDSIVNTILTVNPVYEIDVPVAICEGESITVNGVEQSTDGTYPETFTSINGCDSIVNTILTVNPVYEIDIPVTICEGESLTIDGVEQSTAGTYPETFTSINGCDSIVNTILTVNAVYETDMPITICEGESITIGGVEQSTGGTYPETFTAINGCDSIVNTILTVNPVYEIDVPVTICEGESITIDGVEQSSDGTYPETFTSINGCDSIVNTILTVNPVYEIDVPVTICEGESITIDGVEQSIAGTYPETFTSINGCDSIVNTILTVNPVFEIDVPVTICEGESITIDGAEQSTAGTYPETFTSINGCDSIVNTILTVNPVYEIDVPVTICEGESITVDGIEYSTSGTYPETFTTINGCDSIVNTILTVNPVYEMDVPVTICEGESITVDGVEQSTDGTYPETFTAINGCDSTVNTILTVNPVYEIDVPVIICEGESITIDGIEQSTDGTYPETFTSINGCDSIVNTILTVNPVYEIDVPVTICEGESITIDGVEQSTDGTYPETFTSINGCDSIVNTILTVNPVYEIDVPVTICEGESITVDGVEQSTAGTYPETFTSINGCDSIVNTILTVNPVYEIDVPVTICEGESITIDGVEQSAAGTYPETFTAINGCDSIVNTILTVNPVYEIDVPVIICEGESITIDGVEQSTDGTYPETFTSINGCDSIVNTILTVNPVYEIDVPVTICEGESITVDGVELSTAGTYSETFTTINGCDSIVNTILTVNPIYETDVPVTICEGESITIDGVEHSIAGTYPEMFTTINGCDSIVNTILTVNPVYEIDVPATICEGESITVDGIEYSTSGTYPETFTAINGCDSIVNTILTVNTVYEIDVPMTICEGESITIDGVEQSTDGTYSETFTSINGCDSIVNAILTVNPVYEIDVPVTICEGESITIDGIEQSTDGTYPETFTSINGCDSIVNTILTVNSIYEIDVPVTICEGESITIDGIVQSTTGTYPETFIAINGCDSMVNTILTVNPVYETDVPVTICEGESITIDGVEYSTDGTYPETFTAVNGCDSIVNTILNIIPNEETINEVEICQGETYSEQSSDYTSTGTYYDTYTSYLGCDSLVITELLVNPTYDVTNEVEICEGESYTEGTSIYTQSGDYVNSYISVNGCDSIITTSLVVHSNFSGTDEIEICDGETYNIGTSSYNNSGVYTDAFLTSEGCDSIITTILSVHPTYSITNDISICEGGSYTIGESTYSAAGTFTDMFISSLGCDSLITTVLTVDSEFEIINEVNICEGESYTEGTSTYDSTGSYTDTYVSSIGCDSIVITNLNVGDTFEAINAAYICEGESYTEGTSIYNTTGTFTDVYASQLGCDSIIVTELVVFPVSDVSNEVAICQGENYIEGSSTYSTSGVYTDLYSTIDGCDSTVTTILTVHTVFETTNEVSICEGGTYTEGSSSYTEAGTYTDVYSSIQGCDSTVITVLTVDAQFEVTNDVEICLGETYTEGSSSYDTSGIYLDTYISTLGCDSVVTTNLTVINCCVDQFTTNEVAICEGESYFEQTSEYTLAGTYTDLYATVDGCDSTVTTILIVHPVIETTNEVSICEGGTYTEGSSSYTEAGTYSDVYSSTQGCDSTVITVLTLDAQFEVTNDVEICLGETYTEGSSSYNTSGTYLDTYISTLGCDSVVTTNLTVINCCVDQFTTNEVAICEGESYFEQTSEYTMTGTYTDLYATVDGCDSTVTTILTVHPVIETTNEVSICEGGTYTEGSSNYTAAGTYTDVYSSVQGCDSTVITVLTVDAQFEVTNDVEICLGETYTEGSSSYDSSGTYLDTYISALGCDSVVTTNLTVINCCVDQFTTNEVAICEGESYFEQTSEYTLAGTYTDLYATVDGCDSTVTTILTVHSVFETTNDVSICEGGIYTEGSSSYTEAGTYTDVYSSVQGCDSTVITVLTVDAQFEVINDVEICLGETYTEGSSSYNTSGTYLDTYISTLGCDSVVTTNLTVINCCVDQFTTNEVAICEGESYFEQTSEYTLAGTYTDLYATVDGCDSTVTTILTVHPVFETTNEVSICEGSIYTEGTSIYTAAGTYTDVYSSTQGCDSTVITVLTVDAQFEVTNDVEICLGETYTEGSSSYDSSGTYLDTYISTLGCDSVVTTNLTVINCCVDQFTTNEVTICEGESYFEQTSEYTMAGTYTDLYSTIDGCDSTVTTILTVHPVFETTNEVSICEGSIYTEGTSSYTTAGTYTDIYSSTQGCYSTVITVLSIEEEINQFNIVELCDGESHTEGSSTYSLSGTYEDLYATSQGCDSLVTTELIVHPLAQTLVNITLCEGESYTEGGSVYSQEGVYIDYYLTIHGCDSLVTTVLDVNEVSDTTNYVTITEGESYFEGNSEYTSAGSYLDIYQNIFACDSTVTTVLTVNETYTVSNIVSICDGEIYLEGTSEYTISGTYIDSYTSVLGTDSIVTTILTVNDSPVITNAITICSGDQYTEGGNVYSESGTYIDMYSTVHGCDSTVVTELTVMDEIITTNSVSICSGETYVEGDSIYTSPGTYTNNYTSIMGCDSLVITELQIFEALVSPNFVVLCAGETYTEGTSTYDQSGIYEDVYQAVNGCDSLVITDLLILDTEVTINNVEICTGGSYTEGTSVYTSAGTYEDVYQDIDGCDSLVITNLSLMPIISHTNNVEICTGSSYTEGSSVYSEAGTYYDTYSTSDGCDSLVITVLEISDFVTNTINVTLCDGDTYLEGDSLYTEAGTYTNSYTTITGCDSLVITEIVVHPNYLTTHTVSICEGETYTEGSSNYTLSGTYTDNYQSIHGCDSIIVTELTVINTVFSEHFVSICEGEIYTEGTSEYTSNGTYTDSYSSSLGCDSIVTTHLTVHPLEFTTISAEICEGESYIEGSSVYSTTGVYTDVYSSIYGCDSTVTTLLTVHQHTLVEFTQTVCEGSELPLIDGYFDEPNNRFIDSLQTAEGCDSLVITYLDYINPESFLPDSLTLCEGQSFIADFTYLEDNFDILWNTGSSSVITTLDASGTYWVELSSENCLALDTITIHLDMIPEVAETDFELCLGTSLTLSLPENNGSVVWSDGSEGLNYEVSEQGIYSAQLTNTCGTFNFNYDITTRDCSCRLFIPNAFTANSDNMNDVFFVEHDCNFVEYELLIFNRWGEIIFKTNDPDAVWEGNDENGMYYVPNGVYTYLLKYSSRDVKNQVTADKIYGSVTILR